MFNYVIEIIKFKYAVILSYIVFVLNLQGYVIRESLLTKISQMNQNFVNKVLNFLKKMS